MGVWSLVRRFLIRSSFSLQSSTPPSAVGGPEPISDTERLTRYISEHDHYRPTKAPQDRLHFRAFLPSRTEPDELSIARTDALPENEVWLLGERMITEVSGRPVIARGDFTAVDVRQVVLQGFPPLAVRPDEPPPRHALVFDWPSVNAPDARKSFAQQLRRAARPIGRS